MDVQYVDGTSQAKREQGESSENDPKGAFSCGIPMDQRRSIFLYPRFLAMVLIQGRLNRRSQSALIVFLERNEPERLLGGGHRIQHFGCAKYRSGMSEEHQLDAGSAIQHVCHVEQAASERKGFQFAWTAMSVRQTKDGGGDISKADARAAVTRVRLGEVRHVPSSVSELLADSRRLRKDWHRAGYLDYGNVVSDGRASRF
jgi:hypothetical protein